MQSEILVRFVRDPNVPFGQINWELNPVFRGQYDPKAQGWGNVQPYTRLYGQ